MDFITTDCNRSIYTRNKNRIDDIRVTPDLDSEYKNGSLAVELKLKGSSKVTLDLLDVQNQVVATKEVAGSGKVSATIALDAPHKWSAETPYRYTLIAELKDVDAGRIFIGNGSDEAIDLAFRIFCRPGLDNAVSIAPTYGMYRVAAATNDVQMREVPLGAGY